MTFKENFSTDSKTKTIQADRRVIKKLIIIVTLACECYAFS